MERIDVFEVYTLGSALEPLKSTISRNFTIGRLIFPLFSAGTAVDRLLGDSPPIRIDFAVSAARKLKNAIDLTRSEFFRDQNTGELKFPEDGEAIVETWKVYSLQMALQEFETIFETDMQRAATYFCPSRGTYNVRSLVDNASHTFPENLRAVIGDQTMSEYDQAGRCYAFGLFTAAGYHCCRASEAVLRIYYRIFTGKQESGNETWGKLLLELEGCAPTSAPDILTLGHIKNLKDYYRNPLSHLRANLEEIDADLLLSASKVAILSMAKELFQKQLENEPLLALPNDQSIQGIAALFAPLKTP